MEFLKDVFGSRALGYEDFCGRVQNAGLKLADLSAGAYVGAEKHAAALRECAALRQGLEEARAAADERVAAHAYRAAAQGAAAGLAFTSASARRAFVQELMQAQLPMEGDALVGLEQFEAEYRKKDPEAFCDEAPALRFVAPVNPAPAREASWRERAAANYRRAKSL